MQYFRVAYFVGDEHPAVVYSEVDRHIEIRRVEVYRDGRIDFADGESSGDAMLTEGTFPALDDMLDDPDFFPFASTAAEFEAVWERATG